MNAPAVGEAVVPGAAIASGARVVAPPPLPAGLGVGASPGRIRPPVGTHTHTHKHAQTHTQNNKNKKSSFETKPRGGTHKKKKATNERERREPRAA